MVFLLVSQGRAHNLSCGSKNKSYKHNFYANNVSLRQPDIKPILSRFECDNGGDMKREHDHQRRHSV